LYELREGRDRDRSTFARRTVGHCLENCAADTSVDGIASDR
jgi:hypothetical protein